MASFNKVILLGNMTADPELRRTQNEVSVCYFSIAVNRRYGRDGGGDCDYINIVAWRERAEFITRYFKKGMPILICGQLQTRNWTDNQGQKQYATEVVADEVSFVARSESSQEQKNATQQQSHGNSPDSFRIGAAVMNPPRTEPLEDEGLPF